MLVSGNAFVGYVSSFVMEPSVAVYQYRDNTMFISAANLGQSRLSAIDPHIYLTLVPRVTPGVDGSGDLGGLQAPDKTRTIPEIEQSPLWQNAPPEVR